MSLRILKIAISWSNDRGCDSRCDQLPCPDGPVCDDFRRGRHDDDDGGSPIGTIVMMIVGPIAAMLVQMAISRSREYGADAGGAEICGNPLYLANALNKLQMASQQIPMQANPATAHMFIVNPLSGGALMNLFSTHPPMEERICASESNAHGRTINGEATGAHSDGQ